MTFEKCSCGAVILTLRYKRALQWRDAHRHELPTDPDEPPTVIESGSSHERAEPSWLEENRRSAGFRANN